MKLALRYFVVLICIGIIGIRMKWPHLKFDNLSLYLLIISILLILFPDFKDLFSRLKKLRKGDLELEFGEKLSSLAKKTNEVENSLAIKEVSNIEYGEFKEETRKRLAQASSDPRGALMVVGIEIESKIRKLAKEANIHNESKLPPLEKLLNRLEKEDIVLDELIHIIKEFWSIREKLIHEEHFDLSSGKIYEFTDLGLKILKLLPSKVILKI